MNDVTSNMATISYMENHAMYIQKTETHFQSSKKNVKISF